MKRKKRDTALIVLQTKKPLHQNNVITNNRLRTSTCQLKLKQLNKGSLLGSSTLISHIKKMTSLWLKGGQYNQSEKIPKPRRVTKNQFQRKERDSKWVKMTMKATQNYPAPSLIVWSSKQEKSIVSGNRFKLMSCPIWTQMVWRNAWSTLWPTGLNRR